MGKRNAEHRWEFNREKEVYDAIITKKLPSGRILQPASEHLGKVNRGFAIQNLDMPRWVYRYIGVLSKVAHWKLENAALRPTERARRTHRDATPENSDQSGRDGSSKTTTIYLTKNGSVLGSAIQTSGVWRNEA